ncbi:MAG: fumarylacetoacetate hydrolase family protein [Erythrobacter sp.]
MSIIVIVAVGMAWATSPDPRYNPASFEPDELEPGLAPLDKAITLAQIHRGDGSTATLLVTALDDQHIQAVDLSQAAGVDAADPFAVLSAIPEVRLRDLAANENTRPFAIADLLPAAPQGDRHIGTGTNFPEHADEASSDSVFQFPKFGTASPARTRVGGDPDVLLDYEVELCMRFDRAIASPEDFGAAMKGVFLCGDFTDRGKLIRLIDPDNLDSGRGFSDGKSRADFFPSGALLVVPRDWRSFVAGERMATRVNGERRQDARGGEMTLDFERLVEKALGDMGRRRFLYEGEAYTLAPTRAITLDMTLMSGTAEGVIFTQPTRGDIIEGVFDYLLSGGWLRGAEPVPAIIETFIANETASGHFLQPGDRVEHRSSRLGTIEVEVTGPVD